jgi:hypothetical protein
MRSLKKPTGRLVLALGLTATLFSAGAGAADADGSPTYTDSQLSIASDIASGSYTPAELYQARQDHPLAEIVEDPDPGSITQGDDTEAEAEAYLRWSGSTPFAKKASSVCPAGSDEHFMGHHWTHHSLLGSTIYQWHWNVWYCRNDHTDKITKWTQRADYLTNAQWMVSMTGDQATLLDSVPATKAKAYRQRHLQLCYAAKFACANRYPWGRGTAYGLGYTPYFDGDDG